MPEFEKLDVWRRAHELCLVTYRLARQLPYEERFGLSDQLRRAAVSVPVNIAEGQGRGTAGEFVAFLRIARGSLQEVQALAMIARDLGYIAADDTMELLRRSAQVGRMLMALQSHLNEASSP